MNKLLIPTILATTILIAGVFAFVPVQNASTVDGQIIQAIEDGNFALAQELLSQLTGDHALLTTDLIELHEWVTGGHSDITGYVKNFIPARILSLSYMTGGTDDFTNELPLTPFLVDGYTGEVSIIGNVIPDDQTSDCDWDFFIDTITNNVNDEDPDNTIASIFISDDGDSDIDNTIPFGTDQLFLDGRNGSSDDVCFVAVTIFLDSVAPSP